MNRNEGTVDRISRFIVAAGAVLVSWWVGFGSLAGILLLAFAGWVFVTAALGFCLLYVPLKISTYPSFHRTSTSRTKVATHV